MDPRDVNRINYNNYYVGQNLDFLIRSKMRSESLSTPLTNTPVYYDDQVSSKMALLGTRGFYDPGNIYNLDINNIQKEINYYNNEKDNSNKEKQLFELEKRIREQREYDELNFKMKNDIQEKEYEGIINKSKQNNQNKHYEEIAINNYHHILNKDNYNNNIPQKEDNFSYESSKYSKNRNNFVFEQDKNISNDEIYVNLPKTKEQIQHEVFLENFKKQQLAKEMMREEEMKYKQNLFKK